LGGLFRIIHGVDAVLSWWGEPVYSDGLIAGGVIIILVALIPSAWIETAAKR